MCWASGWGVHLPVGAERLRRPTLVEVEEFRLKPLVWLRLLVWKYYLAKIGEVFGSRVQTLRA